MDTRSEWSVEQVREAALELPSLYLNERQTSDLEQILTGGFAPLTGFMTAEEYEGVLEHMRLPSGAFFPLPVCLDLPERAEIRAGDRVLLRDVYGNPLAILHVSSLYAPDKRREAMEVYGTDDITHPGIRYLYEKTGGLYAGGRVEHIALPRRFDFSHLRKTPRELKEIFRERGYATVIGFQTRNPIHRAHYEILSRVVKETGGHVLVHPTVGPTKKDDIDHASRVRAYQAIAHRIEPFATLSLVHFAMRMAGPREALFHALIRRNYGCTHFIVGRDHAGPGSKEDGTFFYGLYEAQELALAHERELGISIIPVREMLYMPQERQFAFDHEIPPGATVASISGTEFRRRLRGREEIPEWFTFSEVAESLAPAEKQGFTLFLTGLPAAGKSTLASAVRARLFEIEQREVALIDGDAVRRDGGRALGFTKEDRMRNVERIGVLAKEVVERGGIAICAAIAPYAEARARNREMLGAHGPYLEVHVATPLAVCMERDMKGLYAKALRGDLSHVTGIDDPYEAPKRPELAVDMTLLSPDTGADTVIAYLRMKRFL